MDITFLVLMALLLLAIWFFLRTRRNDDDRPPAEQSAGSSASTYHAVSIKTSGKTCRAAKDLVGRRYLSVAAPRLPLPECDVLECHCRFVHHKDRRTGKDRRSPFNPAGFGGGTGNFEQEHRQGTNRRKDDDEDS